MIAVVELGWKQYTVKVGDIIYVDSQGKDSDSTFTTDAMLVSDSEWNDVKVWTPFVDNSKVEFKVIKNFKDTKVRVFKMKSKKRYSRNKWFRAHKTELEVLSIA